MPKCSSGGCDREAVKSYFLKLRAEGNCKHGDGAEIPAGHKCYNDSADDRRCRLHPWGDTDHWKYVIEPTVKIKLKKIKL